jgi:hypothetical protein
MRDGAVDVAITDGHCFGHTSAVLDPTWQANVEIRL